MEVQYRIRKGSPINSILSRIKPIPRIDTYFFKGKRTLVTLVKQLFNHKNRIH